MAADLAELTQALPELCEQLEGRLHALEPFRALQQLAAREAGGAPIEAMASGELRAHLERELAASPDFRVLRLLHALRDELNGALVPVAVEQLATVLPEPPVALVEAATAPAFKPVDLALPAFSTETDVPASAPQWQTDDLHSEASQAVASVFAVAAPAAMDAAEAPLPVVEAAANEPPTAAAPPALPAPPVLVAFEPLRHAEIAEAEATVMASLARLRAAEEEAARAVALAALTPPAVEPPSASMEGAMANVAAAVAATVAAAGRIAEPKPTGFPVSRPAVRSAASPLASTWRERQPSPTIVATAEATEIRFVERPASPMLDIAPRQKHAPLADVPVAPIVALRPIMTSGDHAARDWEEAVVEIRRSGDTRAPMPDSARADPTAALAGRAGVAFGRFVKSLKGEKA